MFFVFQTMDLRLQIVVMTLIIFLVSWHSIATTKKAKFTIEPFYSLHCVEITNVRSFMHCGSKAMDTIIYNFGFQFRDGKCWICRGDGSLPNATLTEYSQSDVYVTGMGTWNDNKSGQHTKSWHFICKHSLESYYVIDIFITITNGYNVYSNKICVNTCLHDCVLLQQKIKWHIIVYI